MIFLLLYISSCKRGPIVPVTIVPEPNASDHSLFLKGTNIWFMTIMIAFLMMFVKRYEWGVMIAVLLSVSVSFVMYVFIKNVCVGDDWTKETEIQGILCSITCSIGIGIFVGTIRYYQYIIVGIFFGASYYLIEWLVVSGEVIRGVVDPGGAISVHMFAAYWGLGVAMAIREKRVCGIENVYTTHSVNWLWLATTVLFILWPSFVTVFWTGEAGTAGMGACLMSGLGSMISAFVAESIIKKGKLDPIIYAVALLGGCVGISCALFLVGLWGALLIGIISGIVSVCSFNFLHPALTHFLGINDVMGVHNLHGVCSWVAVFCGMITLYVEGFAGVWTFVGALISFGIALITGLILGLVLRCTRFGEIPSEELMNDHADFVFIDGGKAREDDPVL